MQRVLIFDDGPVLSAFVELNLKDVGEAGKLQRREKHWAMRDQVETVRSVGYRFSAEDPVTQPRGTHS